MRGELHLCSGQFGRGAAYRPNPIIVAILAKLAKNYELVGRLSASKSSA
jgi:hypothetical protein